VKIPSLVEVAKGVDEFFMVDPHTGQKEDELFRTPPQE